jgi:hypothetical protein
MLPKKEKRTNDSGYPFSYEYIKKEFEDAGCVLLSDKYINARTHLEYICSCGNKAKIIFDSFRRGHRCKICGQRKSAESQKLEYEEVKKYVEEHGCKLLAKGYTVSLAKILMECKCGKSFYKSFANFKQRKEYQCPSCSIKNRSGKNHYEWKKDRRKHYEDKKFRNKCHIILRYCLRVTGKTKQGHTKDLLGYTYKDLKDHIKNHPNWKNVRYKKWHIDHFFPVKAFLDFGINDIKLINCLENLRPISAKENMLKSDLYDKKEFILWLSTKGVVV